MIILRVSGIHRPQKPYNLKQLFLKDYLGGEGKASLFFSFLFFYSLAVGRIVMFFKHPMLRVLELSSSQNNDVIISVVIPEDFLLF